MSEVFICPTGAVSARTIRDLRKAGVVVVETDAPERCQFIRASEVVSGDDMLWAAMSALQVQKGDFTSDGAKQRERLAVRLFELIDVAFKKRASGEDNHSAQLRGSRPGRTE